MGVGTRGVFFYFFQIFHIEYLARFSSKIENFIRIYIRKIIVSKKLWIFCWKEKHWLEVGTLISSDFSNFPILFFVELDIVVSRAFSLFRKYSGPKKNNSEWGSSFKEFEILLGSGQDDQYFVGHPYPPTSGPLFLKPHVLWEEMKAQVLVIRGLLWMSMYWSIIKCI